MWEVGVIDVDVEYCGISVVVIVGDLVLFNVYCLIDYLGVDDVICNCLFEVMDDVLFVSVVGELIDVDFFWMFVLLLVDDIFVMEWLKIVVYFFECLF